MPDSPTSSQIITLQDIRYAWAPDAPNTLIIDEFSIQAKERVFIKGPSGCGKSTLLGLLTGILTPQKGSVNLLNEAVSELSQGKRDRFRADHIGYIFQQFNLLPYLSVIDNVLLPCQFSSTRKNKVKQSLEQEAKHLLERLHLPKEKIHTPVIDLSIGQQQRVAAARALIGHPELLIADEPTSALDHDNREAFIELLMEEASQANTTLVFVSHDPTLEPFFDRTIDLPTINQAAGGRG
ncbi:ABC transporter ATP-binding protein [Vibrio nigripulchritudo]|uniref:ABC transporter ATP-binding protein n=1 Tax=Vibrio nigripulchritudo TaxID=28173 RepID=UPI00190B911E|nr:ABC transporter ATP-binding protein [Vibrio nigripulchritudo]BCL68416.1 ABC transporter ATP-binding protein [Vibrio nigripulchritudo]BDU29744.1 ABC transporter ATP-binding protein [Vibrio nigripulchritudo]